MVEEGNARQVLYNQAMFDFGTIKVPDPLPEDAGFAGFRVHYVFEDGGTPQELLTFLGASYFRAVARNTRFGISARGLALDTGARQAGRISGLHRFLDLSAERSTRSAADLRAA